MSERQFEYEIDNEIFEGFVAAPDKQAPLVLIAHAWGGRSAFDDDKARALADLGYAGVAIDLYGKGTRGESKAECEALMTPFMEDRARLRNRLHANLEMARRLEETKEGAKSAAIGFCFGGLCVLDMARADMDLAAVVSFHGLLGAPDWSIEKKPRPSVLALHGWDDPMAPPDDVKAFAAEFTDAGADWSLRAFGETMHAFTNPDANDPDFGTVYHERSAARAWRAMTDFLAERVSS